jgi:hypothetical protein
MHETSQELAMMVNPDTGAPEGWSEEEILAVKQRAYDAFWQTEVGQKFQAHPDGVARLVEVFGERFSGTNPAKTPFFETLLECAKDLLLELPAPKPESVKPTVNVNLQIAKKPATASKDVTGFAHLYNHQILTGGVNSVKPKAGFVTLDGYDFPAEKAKQLLEEAISFGLIR